MAMEYKKNYREKWAKNRLLLADLVVLEHFSKAHEKEVSAALEAKDPLVAFREVYDAKKSKATIYEHRLDSVLK